MSGSGEVKFHIDETKVTVYRYAERMRDYAVKHLAEIKHDHPELAREVSEALDWLRKMSFD